MFLASSLGNSLRKSFQTVATRSFSNTRSAFGLAKYEVPEHVIVPERQFQAPSLKGNNIMEVIKREGVERADIDKRSRMFRANGKDRVRPGSVLLVETYNAKSKDAVSSFMGVLIAIRRKGIDSSITLRNIILKVGVEQRFSIYSPLVKSIQVLKEGEGFRRAKLYYLRNQPGKAFKLKGLRRRSTERLGN
ncbi:ribosomal protein L19 [Basidiobolus meristosporus CBS 931.73]|uniref:Ribosomal protein L19 n=1 Tax=Basidiobolus meristosporus CBS 931.73 TaxID=1314790 RepID=A0A1Y1ZB25_9FUNG|nr:ribosomal protein L19 [Basidiobolus meristosporus CBS 931.73]|eukprot:ORY07481.1 ribosomal protein L19 [Basidiobolus meristosporus CBS 931.73]